MTKRARVRVARAMATVMRVAGDEEGMTTAARAVATAKMVAASDGDGDEDGDGDSDKGG